MANEAKNMLDKIMGKTVTHAKNNGDHIEPSELTGPKGVANEAQKSNEKDTWTKVKRKRTDSKNPSGSNAVPAKIGGNWDALHKCQVNRDANKERQTPCHWHQNAIMSENAEKDGESGINIATINIKRALGWRRTHWTAGKRIKNSSHYRNMDETKRPWPHAKSQRTVIDHTIQDRLPELGGLPSKSTRLWTTKCSAKRAKAPTKKLQYR